ncbi:anhydro-N-acetylmuramic acid kinase [Virgifigura deserti]|uniref:anhydro-N-acetylmuramic acid kinase n=1 Tax=Virgifigura deserti TaxID=2268457 RepID=UPI003CCBDDBE
MPADSSSESLLALGLMSGTSRDGVDAALVRTDGRGSLVCGSALTQPFSPEFRQRLAGVIGGQGPVAAVERELTLIHAELVDALLARDAVSPAEVAVIGFHGQTILHAPERGRTWQIGDGALLAERTGIDVVNDFRSRDVAEGGQGAPLVPLFHAALSRDLPRPLAVVNIGGVANVTWVGALGNGEDRLLAFDTGPGNALLDDWALRHTGCPFDADGALAGAGRADPAIVANLLAHPYFGLPAPKSLDRDAFDPAPVARLSAADGAATLVAFTAAAIARAGELFPVPPQRWLIAGGGRRNPALMAALAEHLAAPVAPVEAVGWDGDALEAQAFAYLAVRALRGLPLSLPETTGVRRPVTGGTLHRRPAAKS